MDTLVLTEKETKLLIEGLELIRDEVVAENAAQLFVGRSVAAIEEIDMLITKLRTVRS